MIPVLYRVILFQEFGFFGGKSVLRKQFGERIDDEPRKSTQASGASGWKEKKITCNNPYCKVHGRGYQQERMDKVQLSHTDSNGGRYKSRVTNAYGVTDDLGVDGNEDNGFISTKKSRVPSDDEAAAGVVSSTSNVKLKPKRKLPKQIRYTVFGARLCDFFLLINVAITEVLRLSWLIL